MPETIVLERDKKCKRSDRFVSDRDKQPDISVSAYINHHHPYCQQDKLTVTISPMPVPATNPAE